MPAARRDWLETARRAHLERLAGAANDSETHEDSEPSPAVPREGLAVADDDEHLAAYNADLARLNRQDNDR